MILVNKGEEFLIHFNGKEHTVPSGKFEVTQELGAHILDKSKMWGKEVDIESRDKMKTEQVIVPEVKEIIEKKPNFGGATTETLKGESKEVPEPKKEEKIDQSFLSDHK